MNKLTGICISALVGVLLLSGCGDKEADKEPQNEDGFKTDEAVEVDSKTKDSGKGLTGSKGVGAVKHVKGAHNIKDSDKSNANTTPVTTLNDNEGA